MNVKKLLCSIILAGIGASATANETQLIKDSAMAVEGNKVKGWFASKDIKPVNDTSNLPDGLKSSVRIKIEKATKYDGQLGNRVYLKKDKYKTLLLSGYMKSTKSRAAYIQVKLFNDKKNTKRINIGYSSTTWKKYSKTIDVTGINKIEVIFRWRNYSQYLNSEIWVGGLKLVPGSNDDTAVQTKTTKTTKTAKPTVIPSSKNQLINNSAMTVVDGKVKDWFVYPKDLKLVNDSENIPGGAQSSVRIKIDKVQKWDGQLGTRVYFKKDKYKALRLSGYMKSSKSRVAYVQLKLFKGKKTVKRLNVTYSSSSWKQFNKVIDVTGIDKIEAIFRWRYYDRYSNCELWLSGLSLTPLSKSIALAGDSTVQNYEKSSNRRGWGQMLPEFIKEDVAVSNFAAGGKSTKTFRSRGYWKKLLRSKPNYVLIQFGHNDSHAKDKPESTDADGDYKEFLRQYVKEARDAGIKPILVTPPHRRTYRNNALSKKLEPYSNATKAVAAELKVPCIDLYSYSGEIMIKAGDKTVELFCSRKDRSHFSEKGARALAEYVAREMKKEQCKELVK